MSQAKYSIGATVRVIKLLDDFTEHAIIGIVGTVEDVDPLPNGDFNYFVDGHYMHEEELELVR